MSGRKICPYCQNEMIEGKLKGDGRSKMRFRPENDNTTWAGRMFDDEGGLSSASYSWTKDLIIPAAYCDRCKKIIIDTEVVLPK